MIIKAGYKIKLFLGLAITAVVLFTLPFLACKKTIIAVYPANAPINIKEKALISALEKEGYTVQLAPKKQRAIDVSIWFRSPQELSDVVSSTAKYSFFYSEEHYPFDWYKIATLPIVLTPHNDLYEHYVRSNVKAAFLPQITTNTAPNAAKRIKEIINWLNENAPH